MVLNLGWHEVAIRLALAALAGGVIGLDRGEHGRPAGLRTTMLVCLAAAVAMIQANLLMESNGKSPSSFVVLDLMRLPLGILTGMGFIGGGAILRRDSLVLGVTTAATLWFVTVIGLCFGGGQIGLGVAASGLAVLVLAGLRWLDFRMKQDQHGTLLVVTQENEPSEDEVQRIIRQAGYKISLASVAYGGAAGRQLEFILQWHAKPHGAEEPAFMKKIAADQRVTSTRWKVS